MQTGWLRERIQDCRGELAQVLGAARELERFEAEGARSSSRYGWQAGAAEPGAGGWDTFRRRDQATGDPAQRIQRAADRCMAILSEIERDVEDTVGAGYNRPIAEPTYDRFQGYADNRFRGGRYYPNSTFDGDRGYRAPAGYAAAGTGYADRSFGGTGWTGAGRDYTASSFGGYARRGSAMREPVGAGTWNTPRY